MAEKEGWGWIGESDVGHYFIGDVSACGRVVHLGSLEELIPRDGRKLKRCQKCRRAAKGRRRQDGPRQD